MSTDATAWVIQLYALERRNGRRLLHLTKEILGAETEGVLSVELPIAPEAAIGEFQTTNEAARLFDRDFDFDVVVKTFAGYLLNTDGQLAWDVEQARALNRASFLLWILADMEVTGTFVPVGDRRKRAEEYAELWALHPTEEHIERDAAFFGELGGRDLSTFTVSRRVLRTIIRRAFPRGDWDVVEAILAPRVTAPPLLAARRLMPGNVRRR